MDNFQAQLGSTRLSLAQLGSAWLSLTLESILALKFKRSHFCSNTFEFLKKLSYYYFFLGGGLALQIVNRYGNCPHLNPAPYNYSHLQMIFCIFHFSTLSTMSTMFSNSITILYVLYVFHDAEIKTNCLYNLMYTITLAWIDC